MMRVSPMQVHFDAHTFLLKHVMERPLSDLILITFEITKHRLQIQLLLHRLFHDTMIIR